MPNKYIFTHGILIATAIWSARVHKKNQAALNALQEDNINLCFALMDSNARIMYFARMMENDEITLDEFDFIILNDPTFDIPTY